jgi:hypothetical protein
MQLVIDIRIMPSKERHAAALALISTEGGGGEKRGKTPAMENATNRRKPTTASKGGPAVITYALLQVTFHSCDFLRAAS